MRYGLAWLRVTNGPSWGKMVVQCAWRRRSRNLAATWCKSWRDRENAERKKSKQGIVPGAGIDCEVR